MRGTVEERFWAKVDKTDDCWLWVAGKTSGYGVFQPAPGDAIRAHRFSYQQANGPIPVGLFIDHICHNRACVRPLHLRPVTEKQNMENRERANRNSSTGVQGVYWSKVARKWQGQVQHHGKRHYAGVFNTLEEAEAAVIAKRNELFTHNNADR